MPVFAWRSFLLPFAALLSVLGLPTRKSAGEKTEFELRDAPQDPLVTFSPPPSGSVDRVVVKPTGLLVQQGREAGKPVGGTRLKFKLGASGDFRARLALDVNRLDAPSKGWGHGVMLKIYLDDSAQTALQLGYTRSPGQAAKVRVEVGGRFDQDAVRSVKTVDFRAGELAIERLGSNVHFLVIQDDLQHLIKTMPCPVADVQHTLISCSRMKDGNGQAEYLLRKLTFESVDFVAYQTSRPPRVPWWNVFMAANGAVCLGLLALAIRGRG